AATLKALHFENYLAEVRTGAIGETGPEPDASPSDCVLLPADGVIGAFRSLGRTRSAGSSGAWRAQRPQALKSHAMSGVPKRPDGPCALVFSLICYRDARKIR